MNLAHEEKSMLILLSENSRYLCNHRKILSVNTRIDLAQIKIYMQGVRKKIIMRKIVIASKPQMIV